MGVEVGCMVGVVFSKKEYKTEFFCKTVVKVCRETAIGCSCTVAGTCLGRLAEDQDEWDVLALSIGCGCTNTCGCNLVPVELYEPLVDGHPKCSGYCEHDDIYDNAPVEFEGADVVVEDDEVVLSVVHGTAKGGKRIDIDPVVLDKFLKNRKKFNKRTGKNKGLSVFTYLG